MIRSRRIDIRQVFAAILTLSMFAMLANMIKRDHFDYVEVKYPARSTIQVQSLKITGKNSISEINSKELIMPPPPSRSSSIDAMLRFEEKKQVLKPCWNMSSKLFSTNEKKRKSEGYIAFSLYNGPEYHASQVANAVVMAKYFGANLVLPDIIRGSNHNARRNFSEIYDDRKFFDNLKGVVQVVHNGHDHTSSKEPITTVQVPNLVSEAYIEARIKPFFERTRNIRLTTYFPSINTKKGDGTGPAGHLDPVTCLAMFETLRFQPQVRDMFDKTIRTLRMSGHAGSRNVKFVSINLRDEISDRKSCEAGKMSVCGAAEIGEFLRGIGFGAETAIYLTRSRWHDDLDRLRKIFPRTYTKDLLMESDSTLKRFLENGNGELDRVLDLYMCSESDVYVPTNSDDIFSTNVVGNRIASGRSWVLVPSASSFSTLAEYMSPYISKRTHWAYSCFCE